MNQPHHPSPARPLYPVVPLDGAEVALPVEAVTFAGVPFIRTASGQWWLVDAADVAVRDTDD